MLPRMRRKDMGKMRKAGIVVLLAGGLLPGSGFATDTAQSSLYAANAAALACAMTYCETRHGNLQRGSAGAECFSQARGVLAGFELRRRSEEIGARCHDPESFNTCLTPEIAALVRRLNEEFKRQGL